jgi:hypothetical protein
MPPLSSLKRCFISAPIGADTSTLRSELEKRDVVWIDQTCLEFGDSWVDIADKGLSNADFVGVLIPEERTGKEVRSNVLIELGMACAMHKPILMRFLRRPEPRR